MGRMLLEARGKGSAATPDWVADQRYYEQSDLWGQAPECYQVQDRADIVDLIPADVKSVLDVGCGDGFVTNALPQRLRVVGLDPSREALRHVSRAAVVGSVVYLPFEDGAFDLVMANDVLEHIPDAQYDAARRELCRVAAKYVIITVPHGEQLASNLARCGHCGQVYHINRHQRSYDARAMRDLFDPPFRAVEIRYSGDFTLPPFDPTVGVRQQFGMFRTWENTICPDCGSEHQDDLAPGTALRRVFDSVRAMLWADDAIRRVSVPARTEMMALYSRTAVPAAPRSVPTLVASPLRAVCSNPLQVATPGFVPGATWARFTLSAGAQMVDDGVRRGPAAGDEVAVDVRLPVRAAAGDQIEFSASGVGVGDEVSLYAVDGVTNAERELSRQAPVGRKTFRVAVESPWLPDAWGTALVVRIRGGATLHWVDYECASGEIETTMLRIEPGHTVQSAEVDGVCVSWGIESDVAGFMPAPDLTRAFEPQGAPPLLTWSELAPTIERALSTYDVHLRRLCELARDIEDRRTHAERLYAAANQECATLREQIATLSRTCSEIEGRRDAAERVFSRLQDDYGDLSRRLEAAVAVGNEVERQRANVERAYMELSREHARLNEQLNEAFWRHEQTERERMSAQEELVRVEAARRELTTRLDESTRESDRLSEALALLQSQSDALRCEHDVLRGEYDTSLARIGELAVRLDELERAVTLERRERNLVEERLHAAAAERDRSQSEVDRLRAAHEETERQRAAAEGAYARLQSEYNTVAEELRIRRGVKGGTREVLRSLKRRVIGPPLSVPRPVFPEPWKPFDPEAQPRDDRLKVLVLSHMFPHPDQLTLGPFILEQVRSLRQHADIDARVLVGRPYWMVTRNPIFWWRASWYYERFHDACPWYELEGVPVRYLPYRIFAPHATHGWSYRSSLSRGIDAVRQNFPFDVVHAHTGYLDGSAGARIARRYNVPMVITEHTNPFSFLTSNPIVRRWTVRSLSEAQRIVVVSRSQERDVSAHLAPDPRRRMVVIHNGVDLDNFSPPAHWKPDPEAPRFVYVGYFAPYKNLPLLFRAFAELLRDLPRATLALAGCGETAEAESELESLATELGISDRVRFLGFQSRARVAELLRNEFDALVLSSHSETFGCVITEALASGKPAVSTRCGGPEDIIVDEGVGMLADNGDPHALARALRAVAARLPSYSPARIRRFAENHFSYQAVARQIAQLYDEVGRRA